MHPVLRQMRPQNDFADAGVYQEEGEGIARLEPHPDKHPRVQLKKDYSEAYVPKSNMFRDDEGTEPEQMRDLKFKAGKSIEIDKHRVLSDEDFNVDEKTGISPARAHIEAANLVTAYQQTVKEEVNFQKTFNNNVRTLISRDEVTIGMMHLWDFVEAYVNNPSSKALTAQLFLIVQHSRDEGIFKESLLNIAEPEGRWLLDLINILQSIIVQERHLQIAEKVAAINYSVITLGKYYARKIFKSPFVPLDKEVKIETFYMRVVVKILSLCDDLGMYRNEKIEKLVSATRRRELGDAELMFNLKRALTTPDDEDGFYEQGRDFRWSKKPRLDEDDYSDDDDEESDVLMPMSQLTQNGAKSRYTGHTSEPTYSGRRLASSN